MKKAKLLEVRKEKGFSQQQLSDMLFMDVSNYQRRESGEKSISDEEWQRIAEVLEVPVSAIYESDDKNTFIFNDHSQGNGNFVTNCSIPEYLLENQQKYIAKLEQEIEELKNRLQERGKE